MMIKCPDCIDGLQEVFEYLVTGPEKSFRTSESWISNPNEYAVLGICPIRTLEKGLTQDFIDACRNFQGRNAWGEEWTPPPKHLIDALDRMLLGEEPVPEMTINTITENPNDVP